MTMCRLTVRARDGVWDEEVDCWTSLVVLAALSAEPETFAELADAVRRYQPEHGLFDQPRQTADACEAEADGPWCLIDLLGRTVVAGAGFDLPEPHSAFEADEGDDAAGFPIVWLDTPADWLFHRAEEDWRAIVAARASDRCATGRVDARAVVWGLPLFEYVADHVQTATTQGEDATRAQERIRAVHAQWLQTTRADLGGRAPREVLLAERNRLAADLEHRAEQWSRQGYPVAALASDSPAYRLGGFGTTEVVLYFDFARALLAQAPKLAAQHGRPVDACLIQELAQFRDAWLSEPNETTGPSQTPAELIESERRRMPITSDGSDLDHDCPICQAQAAGEFGPAFCWFDGHHLELEDEFAFSLCETRAEWEREQEEYRRFSEKMDREDRERAAKGVDSAEGPADSVWQSSYVNWDALTASDAPPQQLLHALGFPLAELTVDLRNHDEDASLMRSLNDAYGCLRASQDAVATNSAAQEFRDRLEQVAGKLPSLTAKCADLQSRLDEVLRRLS